MQLVVAREIDDLIPRVQVLEAADVLHVAAQPEVIVEVAHHAGPRIPAPLVVRGGDVRERAAIDLRPQPARAGRHERTNARAVRPADRNADDEVGHEVDDGVVAEVAVGAEEARAVAEVELSADDARAHPANVDADAGSTVVEVAAGLHVSPRAYVA